MQKKKSSTRQVTSNYVQGDKTKQVYDYETLLARSKSKSLNL